MPRLSVSVPSDRPFFPWNSGAAADSPGRAFGSMPFFAFSASLQSRQGYPFTISIAIPEPPEKRSPAGCHARTNFRDQPSSRKREELLAGRI
jgi:hypothetical protein